MIRAALLPVAGLLAATVGASGADLALRGAPPAYEPPAAYDFTWSGFYAGVNAGYGFTTNRQSTFCLDPTGASGGIGCTTLPNLDTDGEGFVGGGQVGYNMTLGGFVVGLEADIQYTDLSRTGVASGAFPTVGGADAGVASYGATQNLDYLGTVRARIGYAFDRLLVYGTGGLAYGDVLNRQTVLFGAPGGAFYNAGRRSTEIGYAAGGGVEYAFTDQLTGKAEALYYDLGRSTVSGGATPPTGFVRGATFDTAGVIARAGLNYRFSPF